MLDQDNDLSIAELERLSQLRREQMIGIYQRVETAHRDVPHELIGASTESCDECQVLLNQLCADAGFEDAEEEVV